MLLIISKTALVLFIVSFAIMAFHPKIQLPKHIDFLLVLSILLGQHFLLKMSIRLVQLEPFFHHSKYFIRTLYPTTLYLG